MSEMLTFLFTDIEGSTQLWEKHPAAMKLALARHDEILRQAIEAHAGHVFKTVGDAFCAAFASAPDALAAALDAQRALGRGDLQRQGDHKGRPYDGPIIRVRMGLHSGPAEQRDNDYFGPTLNRVARLMSAGHGGQILLSAITCGLVQNNLPPGADLRDMGEHGLKDLTRPEHIYQLTALDLPADFAALKTLEAFRTNLPVQLTSFIGREKDIETVKSLMAEHRLVTLTGSGGTGKTRLSLQVAADSLDSFPDGVWFVQFAPLSDPALVPQTVQTTLGLREESGRPVLETLTHYLQSKKVLLILDNCEHLVEDAAQLAEALLHGCPNLRLLVSSREALGITGEKPHPIRSLSTPKTGASPTIETATQYEAINLFVDRAKIVSSTFAITPANVRAVAQICTRLDGIPLAIELAAARIKMLKPEQIAERLDDRFRLLTGGSRTALPRQQTLRAMIDWSYDLLPEAERVLLRRLSVFAGGWTLEAAETVCQGPGIEDYDVLTPLSQLVNKSLVVIDAEDDSTETRYRLLETVRQYAREKLSETGEGLAVRDAHLQYFLGLAERAEPELSGPRVIGWLNRLENELDNIRAAMEWALNRDAQVGMRLYCALQLFWVYNYHRGERNWLAQLLNRPEAQSHTIHRARALNIESILNRSRSMAEESLAISRELGDKQAIATGLRHVAYQILNEDNVQRQRLFLESLMLYREINDKLGISQVLLILGFEYFADIHFTDAMKDYKQAYVYIEDALTIMREIEDLAALSMILFNLCDIEIHQVNYSAARRWLGEALAVKNQLGEWGENNLPTFELMGQLSYWDGDYIQAGIYYEHRLSAQKEGEFLYDIDWTLVRLGYAVLRQGDIARAKKLFVESQQLFKDKSRFLEQQEIGYVYILEGQASLATLQLQFMQAIKLFSFANFTRETIGIPRPPNEQVEVDRDLATIRAHLDEAAFAEAQAAGRKLNMDEAIALALESTHD